MSGYVPPRVEVRVIWGEQQILLWKRVEPLWHIAAPFGEDIAAEVAFFNDPSAWDDKTRRTSRFRHAA